MRPVTINKAMNGFVVNVGCQTLVFETQEKLVQELTRYLSKPYDVEKEYLDKHGMANGQAPYAEQRQAIEGLLRADGVSCRQPSTAGLPYPTAPTQGPPTQGPIGLDRPPGGSI